MSSFLDYYKDPNLKRRRSITNTSQVIEEFSRISFRSDSDEMSSAACKNTTDGSGVRNKHGTSTSKTPKKRNGSKSTSNKENLEKVRPKSRKPKKKDSFIVTDSSITDDSVTIYHRVLTERIKNDVKTTPRCISIQNNDIDDGIFTPFINRRKVRPSLLESDSDSNGNENDIFAKFNSRNISDDSARNVDKKTFRDRPLIGSLSRTPAQIQSSNSKNARSSSSSSSNEDLLKKELSWCFSDRESSGTVNDRNAESIPRNTVARGTTSAEKKIVSLLSRTSISSPVPNTPPLTFRLKGAHELTPASSEKLKKTDESSPSIFLQALSSFANPHHVHAEANTFKKKFKKLKEKLAENLFQLFNEHVFENKLPKDLKIEWSARMRSTSGFCYNKRIKTQIGPDNECLRSSRIVLSTKIIETPERLRDTLVHEMCHAAAWIIDKTADGHGPFWKSWVSKVHRRFPDLPRIKRCHDYSIKTKYKYKCVECGYTIGRHSKSLNLERKRCGYCYGRFELFVNNERCQGVDLTSNSSPKMVKARPLSKFALFVKENYAIIKAENVDCKHGDIMKLLSKRFADSKKLEET